MTAEVAEIVQNYERATVRASSPWCSRKSAATYCDCGTTTIDAARACGYIEDYGNESMPRFKKRELDIWIEAGMPTAPNRVAMEAIKSKRKKSSTYLNQGTI